jgi:hypothetical protein
VCHEVVALAGAGLIAEMLCRWVSERSFADAVLDVGGCTAAAPAALYVCVGRSSARRAGASRHVFRDPAMSHAVLLIT